MRATPRLEQDAGIIVREYLENLSGYIGVGSGDGYTILGGASDPKGDQLKGGEQFETSVAVGHNQGCAPSRLV